jgi:hypothetical protein
MEGAILKYKPPIVDAVSSYPGVSPISFRLFQNYPNPFNPKTILRFSIPQIKYVELKIYDILGNEIVTLVNEEKPPGEYEIEFSAKGGSAFGGSAWNLTSGIYFYQLKAEGYVETRKMLLLK